MSKPDIESVLKEGRVFPPPREFAERAHLRSMEEYRREYERSIEDPEGFFAEAAAGLHWFAPWTKETATPT